MEGTGVPPCPVAAGCVRGVFITPSSVASGNETTAKRVVGYLTAAAASPCPTLSPPLPLFSSLAEINIAGDASDAEVRQCVHNALTEDTTAFVIFILHAYRAGRFLPAALEAAREGARPQCRIRVVTIFGGTDVNVMVADPHRLAVMREAARLSDACICFSDDMQQRAAQHLAAEGAVLATLVIPQAASVCLPQLGPNGLPATQPAGGDALLSSILQEAGEEGPVEHLFVAPMGIRAVKDPLFAASRFAEVADKAPGARLLFIGPALEQDVFEALQRAMRQGSRTGLLYHAAVEKAVLHRIFCHPKVCGVVNCSQQEGQPQAVMEGMLCGAPGVMRSIPGNLAIAGHGETALYFDENSFAACCLSLIQEPRTGPGLARRIGEAGQTRMAELYSQKAECAAYNAAVGSLL